MKTLIVIIIVLSSVLKVHGKGYTFNLERTNVEDLLENHLDNRDPYPDADLTVVSTVYNCNNITNINDEYELCSPSFFKSMGTQWNVMKL